MLVNETAKEQLATIVRDRLGADRMFELAINAMRRTPKLQDCDPMSFFNGLIQVSTLGLEPNTPLGHAYLIPYGKECTLVIGYKGFLDLARKHPSVVSVHADVVYDDDEEWSYCYGTDMHLRHRPGPREGKKTHAYCYVKLKDGEGFVVLPAAQIIKTRDGSQGWQTAVRYNKTAKSPWTTHEDAMFAKTAVRAMANKGEMPMSNEFRLALQSDDSPMTTAMPGQKRDEFDPFTRIPDDDDGDFIEGEAQEVEEDKPEPKKPTATARPKAEPKPKADPKPEPEPEKDPEPEQGDMLARQDAENAAAAQARAASDYDNIVANCMDAQSQDDLDHIAASFAKEIDQIKAADADMHARLMSEFTEFAKQFEGDDQ
nr:recombinase RecT [Maritimibacter sp. DP1N21-5]